MGVSKIYAMLSVILAPMTPFYNDRYKLALVDLPGPMVGAWLLIQGFIGGEPLSLLFGLAAIAFTFLKRHKSYDLFEDALVTNYLLPRAPLVVYLREIEAVQVMRQPIVGFVVLVQRKEGAKLVIRPHDPHEMESRLNAALSEQ